MAPDPVEEHARTIADIHRDAQESLGAHQRGIERLTTWLGRPRTLYLIVAALAAWTVVNALWSRAWDPPPFPLLQGIVTALGLLTAMMVLITQNRLARHSERRAQLDLHINLLSEQRTAKLVQLIQQLRHDTPSVKDREDPEAEALQSRSDAREVLASLDERLDPRG